MCFIEVLSFHSLAILFMPCYSQLTVIQGDLVKMEADVIVHPTNASFSLAGEVGKIFIPHFYTFFAATHV